jgi:hypothetical protein
MACRADQFAAQDRKGTMLARAYQIIEEPFVVNANG